MRKKAGRLFSVWSTIFRSTSAGFIGMFALPKTEKEDKPMKNSRREIALVASGIILGASIAAPAAGAALTAQQSSQKIIVDGKSVQIEAYSINGSNYAKIRDIGRAVGFNVSYDAVSNTVVIDTENEYEEESAAQKSPG